MPPEDVQGHGVESVCKGGGVNLVYQEIGRACVVVLTISQGVLNVSTATIQSCQSRWSCRMELLKSHPGSPHPQDRQRMRWGRPHTAVGKSHHPPHGKADQRLGSGNHRPQALPSESRKRRMRISRANTAGVIWTSFTFKIDHLLPRKSPSEVDLLRDQARWNAQPISMTGSPGLREQYRRVRDYERYLMIRILILL